MQIAQLELSTLLPVAVAKLRLPFEHWRLKMAGLLTPLEFDLLDSGISIQRTYFGHSRIFGKLLPPAQEGALT
jgi:hypothetical protein